MDPKNLPGSIKAAILIQSAGKVMSEKILSRLEDEERSLVKNHLAQMGEISPDLIEKVAEEFLQLTERMKTPKLTSPPPIPTPEPEEKRFIPIVLYK